MRILVVEDSFDLADAIADILFDAGHDVAIRAEAGAHAFDDLLELLVAERFDVVLLDLGLGALDGAALAKALALSTEGPAVILCTGADPSQIEPLRGKVAGVLQKPFSPEQLVSTIAGLRKKGPDSGIISVPESGVLGSSKRRDTA